MDTSVWLPYVQSYGYVMLFFFLFCGIVGIPAPEESLLFLVGVMVAKEQLLLGPSLASCWGGAMAGMVTAYGAGRWWGRRLCKSTASASELRLNVGSGLADGLAAMANGGFCSAAMLPGCGKFARIWRE
nr:hypothetical protein [Geobacillus sp. JS12]